MGIAQARHERVFSGTVDVTELWYPSGHRLAAHAHRRPMFCYAIRGRYRERTGARVLDAGPGSIAFLPGGETHRDSVAAGGLHALRVEVDPDWAGGIPELGETGPGLILGGAELYANALVHELRRGERPLQVAVESLAALILAEVARRPKRREPCTPPWILRVRDRIRAEFAHAPSLLDLAGDVDRHPSHVARAFRDHMGCTVGAYLRHCRLDAAKDLLDRTDLPLSRVALDCGYADQSHMGRAFKARFGLSPGAYRNRHGHSRGAGRP